MAAIAGGTVHQETTAQGTTPVMVMETLCAGPDGQTQLQTALHVRTIPDTFSTNFLVWIYIRAAHSRFFSIVEFAEITDFL